MKIHALITLGSLGLGTPLLIAGDYTVKTKRLEDVITLSATAIPQEGAQVSILPKRWQSFTIEKVLPHGAKVKKGDTLIWIDTKPLDKAIDKLEKDKERRKLTLEKAKQEFAEAKVKNAMELEKAKRVYERFEKDYAYFKEVTLPVMLEDEQFSLKRAQRSLSYAQEELKQLLKMYKEDDLTEETEEIIIERTKHGIEGSEKRVADAKRGADYVENVKAARLKEDWETNAKQAKLAWDSAQKMIPRNLKLKQEAFAKLLRDEEEAELNLKEMKEDRALAEFKAPADGYVTYGEYKGGKWLGGGAQKVLYKGSKVPARMTLMTIVPENATLVYSAFIKEAQMAKLAEVKPATLVLENNPWKSYKATYTLPTSRPDVSQHWNIQFASAEKPALVLPQSKAKVKVVAGVKEKALVVPKNAVKANADGTYTVDLKLTDGEPEKRVVEIGMATGNELEIIKGLQAGQVIITPDQ